MQMIAIISAPPSHHVCIRCEGYKKGTSEWSFTQCRY